MRIEAQMPVDDVELRSLRNTVGEIVTIGTKLDTRGNIRCPIIENTIPHQLIRTQAMLVQAQYFSNLPEADRPSALMGATEPGDIFAATTAAFFQYPTIVTSRIKEGNYSSHEAVAWSSAKEDERVFIGGVPTDTDRIMSTLAIRSKDLEYAEAVAVFYGLCRSGMDARYIEEGLRKLRVRKVHHVFAAAIDTSNDSGFAQLIDSGISAFAAVRYTGVDETGKIQISTEDRMRR